MKNEIDLLEGRAFLSHTEIMCQGFGVSSLKTVEAG